LWLIDARDPWSRWGGDEIYWSPDCQQCPFHFEWQYEGGGEANTCEWGVVHKVLIHPLSKTSKNFRACGKERDESPRADKVRWQSIASGCGKDEEEVEANGRPRQPVFPEFMEVTESESDYFYFSP